MRREVKQLRGSPLTVLSPAVAGSTRAWAQAARPATLPAAIVPVAVGTAVAIRSGEFHLLPCLVTLAAAMLIQIGTNFANDLFDFQKGADTAARLGPARVTQSGLISVKEVARATLITFGLSVLAGIYLVTVGGWPILLVGIAAIVAGVCYTGGPWPLGYHGLGDVFVFIFFGLVAVVGTYYVQAGTVSGRALAASIPVGLLCTAIIIVNNVRDIDTDRAAGKRTLAVRIGRAATSAEYRIVVGLAYVVPLALWLGRAGSWLFWLPWLTAPIAWRLARIVSLAADGPRLNSALKSTGRLHLLFGALFALSLIVR
jgi:1,4-dihydroxy-2-naphthoate octaprenyltransferase